MPEKSGSIGHDPTQTQRRKLFKNQSVDHFSVGRGSHHPQSQRRFGYIPVHLGRGYYKEEPKIWNKFN
jgi:hypothetical protein